MGWLGLFGKKAIGPVMGVLDIASVAKEELLDGGLEEDRKDAEKGDYRAIAGKAAMVGGAVLGFAAMLTPVGWVAATAIGTGMLLSAGGAALNSTVKEEKKAAKEEEKKAEEEAKKQVEADKKFQEEKKLREEKLEKDRLELERNKQELEKLKAELEKEEKDFPGGSQPYTKASKPYNPLSPVSSKGLLLAATSGKKPAGPVPLPVTSPASVPASVSLVSANPQPSQQPKPPAAVV